MLVSLLLAAMGSFSTQPADTLHCVEAAHFLRGTFQMQAIVEPDTIDDWRTHKRVSGCRITAAGKTETTVNAQALRFYEQLRAAQWTRTPDPADAPNEASLRFRWQKSDCLFNVNSQAMLNTNAEFAVNEKVTTGPGEVRYQVYVMCMPAMPAITR